MGKIRSTASEPLRENVRIDSETDRILINWGRWCAGRNGAKWNGSALFRLAKSGQDWEPLDARQLATLPIDIEQAWQTEKLVGSPMFYPPYQTMLRHHYVFCSPKNSTCRYLGVHWTEYDEMHWKAASFFRNRFDHARHTA